ncbi:MAG: hypothetical protein II519_00815 [Muribaculaceae bacterium]|nr:hypothetical protein [Muribaculaceae bacterium]
MKKNRQILLAVCAMMALVAVAQQPDPVVASINDALSQAKVEMNKNKGMGNEAVTTLNYTVRGNGKTTETVHFYYKTVEGTYILTEDRDPHFFYYPLFFVTRNYNIGKKKYYEEYLFDSSSQRLLFALTQDYDADGKRFDRRFYFKDGATYFVDGPTMEPYMEDLVMYQGNDLRIAFDNLMRNPKE